MKSVAMLYGKTGLTVVVPDSCAVLEGKPVPALGEAAQAVAAALQRPIGAGPLRELLAGKRPKRVAITISDITRPVPNQQFLPGILAAVNESGVCDSGIVIIVGTGMHRPSTPAEKEIMLGKQILSRVQVIDHDPRDPSTLVRICDGAELGRGHPPVSVCRRFVEADFRIVTGYIEPHFMAGFSGGRKGVCPALVDLQTIQRFHGYQTLADPAARNGNLQGNPCHQIALKVARKVGVDFLFNVAISRDRQIAGIYCGDLEQAHEAGCGEVAGWTTAWIEHEFDLVITNGGGFPLDQTFYQTVKGMCTALPGLGAGSTLLVVSHCGEGVGSGAYADLMLSYDNDWRRFLEDISQTPHTKLDQWEFQMQARVLQGIGMEKLWLVTDAIPSDIQRRLCVWPILGRGNAAFRAQQAIDQMLRQHPQARVAVIPDGPYTMLRRR